MDEPKRTVNVGKGDEERNNHIQFLFWSSTYSTLKWAIKNAEIGLIRWCIDRIILLFQASDKRNYSFVTLWLKRITDSNASTPELRDAIAANMLVNTTGKADTWYESDRFNEILNLHMRIVATGRRNGSFDVEKQMKRSSLFADTAGRVRDTLEAAVGVRIDQEHITPKVPLSIHGLAYSLLMLTIPTLPAGMEKRWEAPNMLAIGLRNLCEGGLQSFNNRVVYRERRLDTGFHASTEGVAEAVHELIDDDDGTVADAMYEEKVGLSRYAADEYGDMLEVDSINS